MARHGGGWVPLVAATSIAGAVGATLLPTVLGRAVDAALGGAEGGRAWVTGCGGLIALILACDVLEQFATGASGASATAWLRRWLSRHVLEAGPGLNRQFQTGDVVSRLIRGTTDAGGAPAAGVAAATSLIPVLGAPVALALIDPWLAVAFVAGLPPLALILRAFVRDTSQIVSRYQGAQGAIVARLVDALGGARTISAAGTLDQESARVLAPLGEVRAAGLATWRALGRATAQGTLFVPLLQVVVIAVGGLELAAGRISPGQLLAASQYAVLGSGVGAMVGDLSRLARARAGAIRAWDLLTTPPMAHGTKTLPTGPGRLEFRSVTIRRDGQTLLDTLDLIVAAGTSVAIVGRSGSGKSMLAALAGRLADPDEGDVLLDRVPLRQLTERELRRAVQYAFERPALLGDTIGDAIRMGATAPSCHQIEAAAQAARADTFIRRLPRGYETPLTEAPMSGGEKQRVGLARAFAHASGARLLVLDDATSSLDTATELQVSRAISEQGDQTRLIVAHRAATAARSQLVVWLDGGRLRACGTHDALWDDADYRAVFQPE